MVMPKYDHSKSVPTRGGLVGHLIHTRTAYRAGVAWWLAEFVARTKLTHVGSGYYVVG